MLYTWSCTAFIILSLIDGVQRAIAHSNTPTVKILAPRSSSWRCVSATDHHIAEQYSKTSRTKPWMHLPISNLSWNTHQDLLKIKGLWETERNWKLECETGHLTLWKPSEYASQKLSWNQMSLTINQGHQTTSAQFHQLLRGKLGYNCA